MARDDAMADFFADMAINVVDDEIILTLMIISDVDFMESPRTLFRAAYVDILGPSNSIYLSIDD